MADHHHGPEADEVGRKIRCHLLQLKRSECSFVKEENAHLSGYFLTLTCRQTHTCDDPRVYHEWTIRHSWFEYGAHVFHSFSCLFISQLHNNKSYHFRKFTLTPNGFCRHFPFKQNTVVALAALTNTVRSCESKFFGTCAMPHGPQQGLSCGTCRVSGFQHQNWWLEEVAFCLG